MNWTGLAVYVGPMLLVVLAIALNPWGLWHGREKRKQRNDKRGR